MTRTERALRRRHMQRKIRETVVLRRFTATLTAPPRPHIADQGTADSDRTSERDS